MIFEVTARQTRTYISEAAFNVPMQETAAQSADWIFADSILLQNGSVLREGLQMNKKLETLKKINMAIDAMDESQIVEGLSALDRMERSPIKAEDPKQFAANILTLKKEQPAMKKHTRKIRIAIAAAAVLVLSISVYAATILNIFGFQQDDRYVTMRTTKQMTEEEAKEFVAEDQSVSVPEEAMMEADSQEFSFGSLQQAEEEMDMIVPAPDIVTEMNFDSADGSIMNYGDDMESRSLWLNYSDEKERMLGITVVREIIKEGSSVTGYKTNDMDEGSLGSYQSKSGIAYTMLTESDESGEQTAHIALAMVGEYEYALVFVGFEESQMHEIIDSVDLSAYK